MATEPYLIKLKNATDFDGATPIDKTLDDFTRTQQRLYEIDLNGGGRVPSDIWGLMSPTSPKLVGISGLTWNPQSVARVIHSDTTSQWRREVDLSPVMQHVVLFPGDSLGILTKDGGRTEVHLAINEMNEDNHVAWAMRHEFMDTWRRFRIIRDTGTGFVANFASVWNLENSLVWDNSSNLLVANDNSEGAIPIRNLCVYPQHIGCFLSVRFANVDTKGRIHTRDPVTGSHAQLDVVDNMLWSKVQFMSHDDQLVLESHGPAVGNQVIADIEIVPARPIGRMRGRYTRGA